MGDNLSGAVAETWARAAGALQALRSMKDVVVHGRKKSGVDRGASISQRLALPEGCELRTVAPVLESECTLVFTFLLLLVEGLEVFAALGFDGVIVVLRGRGMIHWLTVGGLSTCEWCEWCGRCGRSNYIDDV